MRTGLLLAALLVAVPAAAQTNDDIAAQHHFEAGRAYYERAQYEDAAHEFDEAYRLSLRPALLLNVSRALEGAGRFDDAAAAVQRFLDTAAPDDPDRDGTDARLARLRASAARMHRTAPPGVHGDTPTHAPPPATPPTLHEAPPRGGLTDLQVAGIVTGAAGVGFAVAGLILGVVADGIYQNLKMTCPDGLCPPSRQAGIDAGNAESMASSMLFAAAIVAVATGVLLLAFGGYHAPPPAPPAHHAGTQLEWRAGTTAFEWDL